MQLFAHKKALYPAILSENNRKTYYFAIFAQFLF